MDTKPCNGPICQGKELPINSFGKSGKYTKSMCRQCYAISMRKDPDAAHVERNRRLHMAMMAWQPPRAKT